MTVSYGPAMAALKSDRERGFVVYWVEHPHCTYMDACRGAGYGGNENSLRRQGHKLRHRKDVQAAMVEEGWRQLGAGALMALHFVKQIAGDPKHPDQLKACIALMDRGGFGVVHQSKVTHETVDMSSKAIIERIREAAVKLGRDPADFIGANVIDVTPKLIEKEKAEAKKEVDAVVSKLDRA